MKTEYMEDARLPLAIHILYDAQDERTFELAKYIYQLLMGNWQAPLEVKLNIQTDFVTQDDVYQMKRNDILQTLCEAKKNVAIMLVDLYMYSSDDWQNVFVSLSKIQNDERTKDIVRTLPVGLYKDATEFVKEYDTQMIRYADGNFDLFWQNKKDFGIRLFDFIACYLQGSEQSKVFISHAKKDGQDIAKDFRRHITEKTKLNFFFDENCIPDGFSFSDEIEKSVKEAFVVVAINTDAYSTREWCQREIMLAKQNLIPIVVIEALAEGTNRMFPYLGNVPYIQYQKNEDWNDVTFILVKTVLQRMYQEKYLEYIKGIYNNFNGNDQRSNDIKIIPFAPELCSIIGMKERTILYPEPPVGKVEEGILREYLGCSQVYCGRCALKCIFCPQKHSTKCPDICSCPSIQQNCLTPVQLLSRISEGKGKKKIAISVAFVEDKKTNFILEYLIAELARYIMVGKNTLVYGGDLRKGGFTELFCTLAKAYKTNEEYKTNEQTQGHSFINYFSWPQYLKIDKSQEAELKTYGVDIKKCKPQKEDEVEELKYDPNKYMNWKDSFENRYICANALTSMRKERNQNTDILILAGGKTKGFSGRMPGVLEEFLLATKTTKTPETTETTKSEHHVYVIGGFGGMAKIICDVLYGEMKQEDFEKELTKDKKYKEFVEYYNHRTTKENDSIDFAKIYCEIKTKKKFVNIGLEEEERKELCKLKQIQQIIPLVFKGIKTIPRIKTASMID